MKTAITFVFLLLSVTFSNAQKNAATILSKMDAVLLLVKDKSTDVEMQMINLKNGKTKVKKAKLLQKGLDHKLFFYTYPKSDSGIASLTIPGAVYLYMPMFKKPKKITSMAESNTFNKTDFSLEDVNNKTYTEKYTPKMLRDENNSYVLDLIPKNENDGSYSHLIVSINKQHFYPEKIEYYDKKNQKVKIATHQFTKMGNVWVSNSVAMKNLKKNHETRFIMSNIKINQGLKDSLFLPENMVNK